MAEQTGNPSSGSPCGDSNVKSILKHDVEHHPHGEVKFDEMNILETYHPSNKDYGHMKIDEPPTPYNHEFDENMDEDSQGIDADDLAKKLAGAEGRKDTKSDAEEEDEDSMLTEEAKLNKSEFKDKRKHHYNEFTNVQKARELIAKELAELGDD